MIIMTLQTYCGSGERVGGEKELWKMPLERHLVVQHTLYA